MGDYGIGIVGKQPLGMPGATITGVEPTNDYLTHGPIGDGWLEGDRAVTTDFLVSVTFADGREAKLPKSIAWVVRAREMRFPA